MSKNKLVLLILVLSQVRAYLNSNSDFEYLYHLSRKRVVTYHEYLTSVPVVVNLEKNRCSDYVVKHKGVEVTIASLTYMFGQICLKCDDERSITGFIKYLNRHRGSAEEEPACSLERIFVKNPVKVLSIIGSNKENLDLLEWGFVNNHYRDLNQRNCKEVFYKVNPQTKYIYYRYKNQFDYLLRSIFQELDTH